MNEPTVYARKPRRSSVAVAFAGFSDFRRTGRGGTGRGGALAGFFAAGFAAGLEKPGDSDLLTGPGFLPALAASRILAVSLCTFFFAPLTAGGFAVADFLATGCLAAGFVAFADSSEGLLLPERAIARISFTLGRSDDADTFDATGSETFPSPLGSVGLEGADAVSDSGGASLELAEDWPSARAAAKISATDIFFFSAMNHLHPVAPQCAQTGGTPSRTRAINKRS
jgi:hypothetical protein|tara:strand:+ start:952 stop:1629 length:678 start_codon:yes stop_codon:yes gene_type:complete